MRLDTTWQHVLIARVNQPVRITQVLANSNNFSILDADLGIKGFCRVRYSAAAYFEVEFHHVD